MQLCNWILPLISWGPAALVFVAGHFIFMMAHFEPTISMPDANEYFVQVPRLPDRLPMYGKPYVTNGCCYKLLHSVTKLQHENGPMHFNQCYPAGIL